MFTIDELGPEVNGNDVRFRIYLPSIEHGKGFKANVCVISKQGQFDMNVPADVHSLAPAPAIGGKVASSSIESQRNRFETTVRSQTWHN